MESYPSQTEKEFSFGSSAKLPKLRGYLSFAVISLATTPTSSQQSSKAVQLSYFEGQFDRPFLYILLAQRTKPYKNNSCGFSPLKQKITYSD